MPATYSPNITTSKIKIIPPYEDPGVKFQGYSKKLNNNGEYELIPQIRRVQYPQLLSATSDTITREDPDKKFYVSSVHVDFFTSVATSESVRIYDSDTTQNLKMLFYVDVGAGHFDIDFTSCPREFKSPYIHITKLNMNLNNYVWVTLVGWVE